MQSGPWPKGKKNRGGEGRPIPVAWVTGGKLEVWEQEEEVTTDLLMASEGAEGGR
jgi:hypothetical protein